MTIKSPGVESTAPLAPLLWKTISETGVAVRLRIPTEEAELRDHLDRILDKGLSCGPMNQMLLGMTDLSDPGNRMSVSSVDTNTQTYAGRKSAPEPSPDEERPT